MKTSDYINPSLATALYAEIDSKSSSNRMGLNNLKKIVHRLIEESLERGIVSKSDLAKSFITYDNST